MKRYLLFEYADYYPAGGWGDFTGDFDTIEEAITAAQHKTVCPVSNHVYTHAEENAEIIDTETKEEVKHLTYGKE